MTRKTWFLCIALSLVFMFPHSGHCQNTERIKAVQLIADSFPGKVLLKPDSGGSAKIELGFTELDPDETKSLLEKCAKAELGEQSFRIKSLKADAGQQNDPQKSVLLSGMIVLEHVQEKPLKPEDHFSFALFSRILEYGGFNPPFKKGEQPPSDAKGWFTTVQTDQEGSASVTGYAIDWPRLSEIATAFAPNSSKMALSVFQRARVVSFTFQIPVISGQIESSGETSSFWRHMRGVFSKIDGANLRLMDLRVSPPLKDGEQTSYPLEAGFSSIDDQIPVVFRILEESAFGFRSMFISVSAETDPSFGKPILSSILLGKISFPNPAPESPSRFPNEEWATLFTHSSFTPGVTRKSGLDPSNGVWFTHVRVDLDRKISIKGYAQTSEKLKAFGIALKKSNLFPVLKMEKPTKVLLFDVPVGQFEITGELK